MSDPLPEELRLLGLPDTLRDDEKDNIKWGTASTGGARSVYFDSTKEDLAAVMKKIDLANAGIDYATRER